ncbi:hypothetical protein RhiirC2_739519 [Rhizophagus irregularis]|uniref:Uncharacterized protein n=1 Tax=Rhizophagus irregularis TaxID=588596 RepID=A0A2N1NJI6_9GLOM|nr:hypothetical protein RhiirC2_739519 [Rhizophagus irregularis]
MQRGSSIYYWTLAAYAIFSSSPADILSIPKKLLNTPMTNHMHIQLAVVNITQAIRFC